MSSTYRARYFQEPKENNIKYKLHGNVKLLLICLNYQGTDAPLSCIVDGKNILKEAKKSGVKQISALFDDGSTELYPNAQNVLNQMADLAASCEPGDCLVVYYSGHGTSVEDQDGDEEDGMDQAFCLRTEEGQDQTLIDDQIADTLSTNLPDNVPCLFMVDACHSGTILDLQKRDIWRGKKVFCISGCQDTQYSTDTGNGGQMTNILLEILRNNRKNRKSKALSIQYIFNRMVFKNEEVQEQKMEEGEQWQQEKYEEYEEDYKSYKSRQKNSEKMGGSSKNVEYEDYNFDDEQGQEEEYDEQAEPGQWINLSWNGGTDPTKIPFPL